MKKIISLLILMTCAGNLALSQSLYVDPQVERYKEYNPDGEKYEFVKAYITGLTYIYDNELKSQENQALSFDYLQNPSNLVKLRDSLVVDNINLRIARNFVKKYNDSDNGLILKVTDLFVNLCDDMIDLNDQEKDFYNSLVDNRLKNYDQEMNKKEIAEWQIFISQQRKEKMMSLLESSMLVSKVLVSDQVDGYGDLSYLGITENQKYNLLVLLEEFEGQEYEGEMREGQSFLGASISVLKQILNNQDYSVLAR